MIYLMGVFYVIAGLNHFRMPYFYEKMIRDFIPYSLSIIYLTGIIEILLGIAVCIPETKEIAAAALVAFLLAIFPANIYMALNPDKWKFPKVLLYLRIPLQALLIYWAWIYT